MDPRGYFATPLVPSSVSTRNILLEKSRSEWSFLPYCFTIIFERPVSVYRSIPDPVQSLYLARVFDRPGIWPTTGAARGHIAGARFKRVASTFSGFEFFFFFSFWNSNFGNRFITNLTKFNRDSERCEYARRKILFLSFETNSNMVVSGIVCIVRTLVIRLRYRLNGRIKDREKFNSFALDNSIP